jgi:hypothetical protein
MFQSKLFIGLTLVVACIYFTSPVVESPSSYSSCTGFCNKVFGRSYSAYSKTKMCKTDANNGVGICYACGPKAAYPTSLSICWFGTKHAVCVDKKTDEMNCGRCGHKCHYGKECCKGNCYEPCEGATERDPTDCQCKCALECPGGVLDPVTCTCQPPICPNPPTCVFPLVLGPACTCICGRVCAPGEILDGASCTCKPADQCPFPNGRIPCKTKDGVDTFIQCECGKFLNQSNQAFCPGFGQGQPCIPCTGDGNQLQCGLRCCDGKHQRCSNEADPTDPTAVCIDGNPNGNQ